MINKNQTWAQVRDKLINVFTLRQVVYFVPLGIFFSWRTRNLFNPLLFGESSKLTQITIVILLTMLYIFLLFSISYVIHLFTLRYLGGLRSKFFCGAILFKQNALELPAITRKEQKITIISFIIYLGFVLSIFYHYVMGTDFGYEYPYNTFLFRPWDRWADFTNLFHIWKNPYSIESPARIAFPFLYKIFSIFTILSPEVALSVFLLICLQTFAYICYKQLRTEKSICLLDFLVFTFLTYPLLFVLDRANPEIVVFFCLYLYVFLYRKHSSISAVFLGISIALKVFPVIFAIFLLTDRKYKEIAIAAIISISATLLSYATLPGGISENIPFHLHNLQLYTQEYAIKNEGLLFGNSLWGGIKFVSILTGVRMMNAADYTIMIVAGLICLVSYIAFIEKEFWKKVTLLVCALNLFPQVSGDYKLLHIFIPIFLFINDNESESNWDNWLYLTLFGLLLIPKDYYRLPTLPEANTSALLNPLLMLIFITAIMIAGSIQFFKGRLHSPT
jgi:hypothetical protein